MRAEDDALCILFFKGFVILSFLFSRTSEEGERREQLLLQYNIFNAMQPFLGFSSFCSIFFFRGKGWSVGRGREGKEGVYGIGMDGGMDGCMITKT